MLSLIFSPLSSYRPDTKVVEICAGSGPDGKANVLSTAKFNLDGEGQWIVDLTQEGGKISEGVSDDPDCVVTAKGSDFGKLLDNPAKAMFMFTMNKLKVSNISLGMALKKLFG